MLFRSGVQTLQVRIKYIFLSLDTFTNLSIATFTPVNYTLKPEKYLKNTKTKF